MGAGGMRADGHIGGVHDQSTDVTVLRKVWAFDRRSFRRKGWSVEHRRERSLPSRMFTSAWQASGRMGENRASGNATSARSFLAEPSRGRPRWKRQGGTSDGRDREGSQEVAVSATSGERVRGRSWSTAHWASGSSGRHCAGSSWGSTLGLGTARISEREHGPNR